MLVLKLERLKATSKRFMKPTIVVATYLKSQDVITIALENNDFVHHQNHVAKNFIIQMT
jgi:hypothetical protein